MTLVSKSTESLAVLKGVSLGKIPNEPAEFTKKREAAMQRFQEQGLPTSKNESWKYTNVTPLTRVDFQKPSQPSSVTVSTDGALPAGVHLLSLSAAFANPAAADLVRRFLGSTSSADEGGFGALNLSSFDDGAFLYVPDGVELPNFIKLSFASQEEKSTVVSPRVLIVLGKNARANIVEEYRGNTKATSFTNPVVEVILHDGASLSLTKVQREKSDSFHLASTRVEQGANTRFTSHFFSLGGALVRNEILVRLSGQGSEVNLNGFFIAKDKQHVDNYTFIDHVVPHCRSRELYKGILDGASTGVFFGRVRVEKDAQKTDSVQSNKNLVLSNRATINSRPQLEIYADDVKCNHGSAIGQLDETALFYLRSRGIGPAEAKQVLTYAFGAEMVREVGCPVLQEELSKLLHKALEQKTEVQP